MISKYALSPIIKSQLGIIQIRTVNGHTNQLDEARIAYYE